MKKTVYLLLVALSFAACKKSEGSLSDTSKKAPVTEVAGTDPKLKTNATLSFAGYTWAVTTSSGAQQPGPNVFTTGSAYVDASGFLHLKIKKNTSTGKWECGEVTMLSNLGYGTYQWKVEGAISTLDKNIVFGMFNYSGNDLFDEMDIEYSKWGYATNNRVLNYTLYPATGSSLDSVETTYPVSLTGTYTTQRFKRSSSAVTFKSLDGFHDDDTNLYASKTWTSPPQSISTLAMPVMMNLWLFNGKAPSNNQNVEIIIHDFKFTPL
jgi:hypothetical protein